MAMVSRSSIALGGRGWRLWLSLFFCLTLALAPSLAEARAGSSGGGGFRSSAPSSMGSRGTRTFENNGAAPITRSASPQSSPSTSAPGSFGAPSPALAGGGSFFQRHPFLSGLAGGFLGAALFSHLGGIGHIFGGLLQFLIIGLLIFFVIRLFTGRGFSFAGAGRGSPGGNMMPASVGAAAAPSSNRFRGTDTTVSDADLNAFQGIHAQIQEAWSNSDLGRMRQLMTPEMLGYFSEELSKNTSQGVQNVISNIQLVKGDITESWTEGDMQYATAYLRWRANDFVVRLGSSPGQPDAVVSGDPRTPIEQEEVWTFVRRRGGNWLLSAIQQV